MGAAVGSAHGRLERGHCHAFACCTGARAGQLPCNRMGAPRRACAPAVTRTQCCKAWLTACLLSAPQPWSGSCTPCCCHQQHTACMLAWVTCLRRFTHTHTHTHPPTHTYTHTQKAGRQTQILVSDTFCLPLHARSASHPASAPARPPTASPQHPPFLSVHLPSSPFQININKVRALQWWG